MGKAWDEIRTLHEETTRGAKGGLAFKYFSRPLASVILFGIQRTSITPNQVTIASLLVGVAGSVVHMTVWTWGGLLAGSALFMLAHVLDALDGQLARHRGAGSVVGMYFDFFIDEVKAYLMYVALTVRLFFQATSERDTGWFPGTTATPGEPSPASPTWLLDLATQATGWRPTWILLYALAGTAALAIGISCTQFMKRREWKEAFPSAPDAPGRRPGIVARIEGIGHFVVDYPSYIVPLCLLNRVDVYFLVYTLVVMAYAARALTGISRKLWRVDPYGEGPRGGMPPGPRG
jgi:hypothetical protein